LGFAAGTTAGLAALAVFGFAAGGIEHNRKKTRQHTGADAAGEGLALGLVLLTMAFDAMAEDLMEKDARGPPGENGGPDERLGHRRLQQSLQFAGGALDRRCQRGIVGQIAGLQRVEIIGGGEVHAIGGLALRRDDDAREPAAMLQAGALGCDQRAAFGLGNHRNARNQHVRIFREQRGERFHPRAPGGGIEVERDDGLAAGSRRFVREVGRLVAVRDLHLAIGADLDEALGGGTVGAVGFEPEAVAQGGRLVVERDGRAGGELPALARGAVIVIQLRRADAHRNVQVPVVHGIVELQSSQVARHHAGILFGHFVGEKVGRRLGFGLERLEIALELVRQDVQQGAGRRRFGAKTGGG